jgi:hypothetical protein
MTKEITCEKCRYFEKTLKADMGYCRYSPPILMRKLIKDDGFGNATNIAAASVSPNVNLERVACNKFKTV